MSDTLCKHCDHFVDENWTPEEDVYQRNDTTIILKSGGTISRYIHMDDGEQEYNHDAEPGETRDDWKTYRPDLFITHADGRIGPNSIHHSNLKGKIQP